MEHDFLWRTSQCLPERGRIGIFNRSYYEEVLIVRVHPEILRSQGLPGELRDEKTIWQKRYRSIVNLEKHLHRNGTRIIKFFLHLSKQEQRKRFLQRIDEPDKNWKFGLADIEERKFWKHYMNAYEACLSATSTKDAPWHVVPADDKENARLIISEIILEVFNGLKMAYPKPSAKRRRELHLIRKSLVKLRLTVTKTAWRAKYRYAPPWWGINQPPPNFGSIAAHEMLPQVQTTAGFLQKGETMTERTDRQQRSILQRIAYRAMLARGLLPDFSPAALAELDAIHGPATLAQESPHDLRNLNWCSIDNDDSRDLDQLTFAEALPGGAAKILVAIADVDALVKNPSALDDHARHNTTSVYTAAKVFPMLPEKLSTDFTSLNYESDRLAIVIEMLLAADGSLQSSDIYRATVRNHAKLAYNSVAAWLEVNGPMPQVIGQVDGLEENLRLQDRVAQRLKALRHEHGALNLETIEARPVFDGDELKDLEAERKSRAKEIIEDFMIAANGVTARYLAGKMFPSLRRVVRTPKRWDRIVELAADHGFKLSREPDSRSLGAIFGFGESRRSPALPRSFP